MKTKKLLKTIMLVSAVMLVLAGCGSSNGNKPSSSNSTQGTAPVTSSEVKSDEPEIKELTLVGVIDAQVSSQQIIADKLGFFEEEGLKVTNQLIQNGVDLGSMISGGSAPISFETNITDMFMAAAGVKVSIVAPMAQIAGTQGMVAYKDTVINSAKDLEGLTIGMPSGAGALVAVQSMAKELGVDVTKINFINLAPNEQITAMEHGNIDAMVGWEPYVTKSIDLGGKLLFTGRVSHLPEKSGPVEWMSFHSTMQVTDDYLAQNPNTVKAVLRAIQKATDYINNNREEAIKILAPELQLEENELRQIMDRNTYSMKVDESFVNGTNQIAEFMKELGNIDEVPNLDGYVDFTLLKELDPALVTVETN